MVSSSFLWGKLLRSVLQLFHQAFVQCVRTGTGALTGLCKNYKKGDIIQQHIDTENGQMTLSSGVGQPCRS